MAAHFSPAAMKFMRGLVRNNDREWFEVRRAVYEQELKAPMLALIDEVSAAMTGTHARPGFAEEHVRPANKIMMRIYRDTRFSRDKRPYKSHVAAWWAKRGMEKTSGGGYYVHVGPTEVMISAGVYMPERDQLLAIRRWMSAHHAEYRALVKAALRPRKGERFAMSGIDGQLLTRLPKGFAKDDPADELLRARNWGVHLLLPAEAALEASFVDEIVRGFRRAAPIVQALNGAIEEQLAGKRDERPRRFF
jgi:uncharacterized protein (TIGR02453 family)